MTDLIKYISAKRLMERWKLEPLELKQLPIRGYIKKHLYSYPIYEGIHEHEYEYVEVHLAGLSHNDFLKCQFKLSDVYALEEKHSEFFGEKKPKNDDSKEKKSRPNQLAKEKCREIAEKLWKEHYIISKEMADRPEIKKFAGSYTLEQRRRWICDLAPEELKKGGTPKRKSSK